MALCMKGITMNFIKYVFIMCTAALSLQAQCHWDSQYNNQYSNKAQSYGPQYNAPYGSDTQSMQRQYGEQTNRNQMYDKTMSDYNKPSSMTPQYDRSHMYDSSTYTPTTGSRTYDRNQSYNPNYSTPNVGTSSYK